MMEKKMGVDTLHHAALRVKDVMEAVDWYTERFRCEVEYREDTWALLAFDNVRLPFVLEKQHPPYIAIVGDPKAYGTAQRHRDGTL